MAESLALTLEAALLSSEVHQGEAAGFWRYVDHKGDIVYFELFAWDGGAYVLELTCDQFQKEPILGRFVDPKTRQCVTEAWPRGGTRFAEWFKWETGNLFICWPGDRGGISHHAEWRQLRHWNKTPNPLHQYLEFIRQCLTIRGLGYQPRKSESRAA